MAVFARFRSGAVVLLTALAVIAFAAPVSATHSWNNYHWARTSNPFTLKVVDSNTSNWDDNLNAALTDWSTSSVLNLTREAGDDSARTRKRCPMIAGKVRSCNAEYGANGWLGLASINVSGGHITQGTSKMNDTYLAASSYTETNRQHVMCQEIGHDFGLGHQDESGADLNTCMDYADSLNNPKPNAHDYNLLEQMYTHLDSSTTIAGVPASAAGEDMNTKDKWGKSVKKSKDGRQEVFELDLDDGSKIITFVTWAEPH